MTGKVVAEAPAPGSLEDVSRVEGAADGGCTSADKAIAPGKGVKIYADVHKTNKNGEGFKITFTADGVTFGNTDSPSEIPVNAGDKLFVDTVPIQHTDAFVELLRRGVDVYYLRRLTLVAKKREELKLSKTARNDIKVLMSLEGKWFRRVSEDFLVMRRLTSTYRTMLKTHQQYVNRYKAVSENERNELKTVIEALEEQMNRMASKIAVEAGKRYPAYNRLVEELGIDGSPSAKEALAELLTYIDFANSPLRGIKKLLGLYKPVKSKKKKHWRLYDGVLRQALHRLAIAYYGTIPNGRQCWQLARKIKLATAQTPG